MANTPPTIPLGQKLRTFFASYRQPSQLVAAPTFLLYAVAAALILMAIALSLYSYDVSHNEAKSLQWGASYLAVLFDVDWRTTLILSLLYALIATSLSLSVGFALALLLQPRNRIHNAFAFFLIIPAATAPVIAATMWSLLIDPQIGLMPWLGDLVANNRMAAIAVVLIVDLWVYSPCIALLLLIRLRMIPQPLYETARLDNIPPLKQFHLITLPLLIPYIVIAGLLRFIIAMQQFDLIYIIMQGSDRLLAVFQVEAYQLLTQSQWSGQAATLMIVLWALTALMTYLFVLRQRRCATQNNTR